MTFLRSRLTPAALTLCAAGLLAVSSAPTRAQAPGPRRRAPRPPAAGPPAPARPGQPGTPPAAPKAAPKPYADVVTKDAKSDPGLFTVHRIDDKILWEIPASQLEKPMLWVTEIAQLSSGGNGGYGGQAAGNRVVRWTRRGNTVYLRDVDFSLRADAKLNVARAVADASLEPILMAFNVEAEGKDKSAVIDVTRLLTSDPPEFSVRGQLGGGGVDPTRSYVDRIKSFPTNIETNSLLTFAGTRTVSAEVHYSMVLLPEKPMMGRLSDSRVGFFSEGFQDYGRSENRVAERSYIDRYRLEKKDPSAPISEPVKPIVYYIGREVPEVWRPYLKKAVESWNVAFEQAGFKNAIVCKDPPTEKEDPNWDPEDARYSVIRWAPTTTENAMGPNVHDPRSGEILEAHIIVWHNVLKLAEDWYFVQAAAQDPRARKLPLPDDLMGEIIQYVVTHEVGHTLGLYHNFKASSAYSVAQLRDPKFTEQYGDEASIMDYGRFNYVAQPGDGARLIPKIGPYDKFAIQWGYTPIVGAKTPDDEKPTLDRIASKQVIDPTLRFGHGPEMGQTEDPTQRTEDLGSDPIAATAMGLKNINRTAQFLVPATTKPGEDYDRLEEMYQMLLRQRTQELSNVVALIGGVEQTDWHVGYGENVFQPVAKFRQSAAMQFLIANAFITPVELLRPNVLYRIQSSGAADTVLSGQRSILTSLLSEARLKRMADMKAVQPVSDSYTIMQMMTDLQKGLWKQLDAPKPMIDLYQRNLQRAYLDTLNTRLNGAGATQTDLQSIAPGMLKDLSAKIDKTLPRVTDRPTRLHLLDAKTSIARILNPSLDPPAASSGGGSIIFFPGANDKTDPPAAFPDFLDGGLKLP